jgi:hypothetical protein
MTMRSCVRFLTVLLLSLRVFAQTEKDKLTETILHQDGLFWDAYNRCDADKMSEFFSPDIEFYHDKGGATIGAGPLVEAIGKGLCGNPNSHLRREAIPDTAKVFPLEKNGEIYGAVLYGEHYFYVNDKGKPEYRDGMAKYFDVWLLKDGKWKMSRVVSYDHHQAPPVEKKEATVAPQVLEQYVGKYLAPRSGTFVVARNNNLLWLTIGEKKYELHPESESVFFTADRDLTFEFVKEGSKVSRVVVREHGAIVEEAKAE